MKKILAIGFISLLFLSFIIMLSLSIFAYRNPEIAIEFFQKLQPTPTIAPVTINGMGVIGDSLSDEYRADDRRGWTYASTTMNWVELLAKYRNINFGAWKYYEEPRREGYAYDFARTSETVAGAVDAGQHTGLADEIKKRNVNVVVIYLGVNDFSPLPPDTYGAIYSGSMTDDQIRLKINRLVADMKTMIETLQDAGDVHILLVTIPDWGRHALIQLAYPIPSQRDRVSSAIAETNAELTTMAKDKGIAVADINTFYDALDARDKNDTLQVGNVGLNKYFPGDDPHDVFLDDGVHPGTVFNGLFANFIMHQLNAQIGTSLQLFSDQQILSYAGL